MLFFFLFMMITAIRFPRWFNNTGRLHCRLGNQPELTWESLNNYVYTHAVVETDLMVRDE